MKYPQNPNLRDFILEGRIYIYPLLDTIFLSQSMDITRRKDWNLEKFAVIGEGE